MKHKLKNERGYTLQELLVAIPLGMLIMTGVMTVFISQSRSYHAQEQLNEMQQNARAAMDIMVREIKMTGYDPTGIGFNALPTTSATQIQIVANNVDETNGITDPNEVITYNYDAANNRIQRTVGITTTTLAENISDLEFEYLDENGTVTAVPADIRQIQIEITAETRNPDPNYSANGGIREYELESVVTPPNLDF